jgi:hypothetical protein
VPTDKTAHQSSKGTGSNGPSKPQKSGWRPGEVVFLSSDLSVEEKLHCKAWASFNDDADGVLDRLCADGYRVSIKQDTYSGGFQCSITPGPDNKEHAGFILMGRGSTPLKSARQACYRHFVLYGESWPVEVNQHRSQEFDD